MRGLTKEGNNYSIRMGRDKLPGTGHLSFSHGLSKPR
jgi:hypothetical protein